MTSVLKMPRLLYGLGVSKYRISYRSDQSTEDGKYGGQTCDFQSHQKDLKFTTCHRLAAAVSTRVNYSAHCTCCLQMSRFNDY